MKPLFLILFFSAKTFSQDSVTAKVIKTSEKTVVFEINKMRFVSFDCACDTLKRGMEFKISKPRFDSLLKEARPIRRKDL